MLKKLLCITLSALLLAGITLMNFNADSIISSEDNIVTKKDVIEKYEYNPEELLNPIDFDTDEEYEEYISEVNNNIIQSGSSNLIMANSTNNTKPYGDNNTTVNAQKKYTIKNLPTVSTIQNFHVGTGYIFTTQTRKNSSNGERDVYISRCKMSSDGKTAVYMDKMILKGFGHDQILTPYSYKNKTYFWIGCKPCPGIPDTYLTTQLGRIQYQAGKVYTNYSQICRFGNLNYANKNCTSIGAVKRVDAALSSDKSTLLIAVRSYKVTIKDEEVNGKIVKVKYYNDKDISYSCYNNTKLNQALDKVEADPSTNLVVFKDNTTLKNACLFTVIQPKKDAPLPYNSCQGLELTNAYYSIYIAGGAKVKNPQILKMVKSGNKYIYTKGVIFKNQDFDSGTEIEGLQGVGDYLYFAITNVNKRSTTQCIYSVAKKLM